jgi:phenylacetic acid degradation operon negative regulatory protein
MKKDSFIPKFIETVLYIGKGVFDVWAKTSYKGYRPRGIYTGIKNLERRGIIKPVVGGHAFTLAGKKWFGRSLLKYHKQRRGKWDGKWRIVIFDIPQELHKNRNYFRNKLRALGFYMVQKSVFVFPYPCGDELGPICGRLQIGDYVDLILAESVGFKEKEIRKYFDL